MATSLKILWSSGKADIKINSHRYLVKSIEILSLDGATVALQSLQFQLDIQASPNPALSPFPGDEPYTPGFSVPVLFPTLTQ